MGSANIKAVRKRIHSVSSTMHITRAMQLVASSKTKRALERLGNSRYFFSAMQTAFYDLADSGVDSVYLRGGSGEKSLCIVIAGDRGLAGGYNNNVFKAVRSLEPNTEFLPVGKRAQEFCHNHGYAVCDFSFPSVEHLTAADCDKVAKALTKSFGEGNYREINLIYTHYRNMLSQETTIMRLLPAAIPEKDGKTPTVKKMHVYTCYEPSPAAVLSAIVPIYLAGVLYGSVSESYASEVASRRNAMDNATKNASEMIDRLSLQYNRARQSTITGEITEIVAGSEQS